VCADLLVVLRKGWTTLLTGEPFLFGQASSTARINVAPIIDLLQRSAEAFASFLEDLSEGALGESVLMPGGQPAKSRFEMLLSVKEHEMHHRGQLVLIERELGIVPHLTREREARFAGTAQQPSQT